MEAIELDKKIALLGSCTIYNCTTYTNELLKILK